MWGGVRRQPSSFLPVMELAVGTRVLCHVGGGALSSRIRGRSLLAHGAGGLRASTGNEGGGQRCANSGQKRGGLGTVDIPMRHIHIIRLEAVSRGGGGRRNGGGVREGRAGVG